MCHSGRTQSQKPRSRDGGLRVLVLFTHSNLVKPFAIINNEWQIAKTLPNTGRVMHLFYSVWQFIVAPCQPPILQRFDLNKCMYVESGLGFERVSWRQMVLSPSPPKLTGKRTFKSYDVIQVTISSKSFAHCNLKTGKSLHPCLESLPTCGGTPTPCPPHPLLTCGGTPRPPQQPPR